MRDNEVGEDRVPLLDHDRSSLVSLAPCMPWLLLTRPKPLTWLTGRDRGS